MAAFMRRFRLHPRTRSMNIQNFINIEHYLKIILRAEHSVALHKKESLVLQKGCALLLIQISERKRRAGGNNLITTIQEGSQKR